MLSIASKDMTTGKANRAKKNRCRIKIIALSVLIFYIFSASCSTTRTVNATPPKELANVLNIGDRVQVTIYSGERHRFRIEHLSDNAIEGKDLQIAFDEIDRIEKEEFSAKKTIGLFALVVVIIAVVAAVVIGLDATEGGNGSFTKSDKEKIRAARKGQ